MKSAWVLITFILLTNQVFADIDGAASWLLASQNPDGSWGDEEDGIESKVYVTASVLEALQDKGLQVEKGQDWIGDQEPKDVAALSRSIRILQDQGLRTKFSERVKASQNPDGGWGKAKGFGSTPWYTSNALLALYPLEEHQDSVRLGGDYLIAVQKAGNWGNSSFITSNCIYALALLYNSTKEDKYLLSALKGKDWLLKNRGKDLYSTSNSVIALMALHSILGEEETKVAYQETRGELLEKQDGQGHWGSPEDPLQTAWVLSALTKTIPFSPAQPKIFINLSLSREHVLPTEEIEVFVEAENIGVVNVRGLEAVIEFLDKQRELKIGRLSRGESNATSVVISIPRDAGEGTYPVKFRGRCIADNVPREGIPVASEVNLSIHRVPFELELLPRELKNDVEESFWLSVKNLGDEELAIRNISINLGEGMEGCRAL